MLWMFGPVDAVQAQVRDRTLGWPTGDMVVAQLSFRAGMTAHFQAILNTPPFPEYPSGHSTQSGAAATVLTAIFGPSYSFLDGTHEADGLPVRSYPSFWAAAEEAGISRLYGGIHFPDGNLGGQELGRRVGAQAWAQALSHIHSIAEDDHAR